MTSTLSPQALRKSIESWSVDELMAYYADDAVMTVVDHVNQPQNPTVVSGAQAIRALFADIDQRHLEHTVVRLVADDTQIAIWEQCVYPNDQQVASVHFLTFDDDGLIVRHNTLQAWDE